MTVEMKAEDLDSSSLQHFARILRSDGVICFPADTAYGLAVNPFSPRALERLFALKARDEGKPILLLVDSMDRVEEVAWPTDIFKQLARAFWPGPLTLVTPARAELPDRLTGGKGTVGLRWPDAAVPLRLISAFDGPITATSANRSGRPVVPSAREARNEFGTEIDVLIDGGEMDRSLASTVLNVSSEPPTLLREGPVSFECLNRFLCGRLAPRSA